MALLRPKPLRLAVLLFCLFASLPAFAHASIAPTPAERRVVELANRDRAAAGLQPLLWDSSLAEAAHFHSERMAQEGPIAHRYGGEPDLAERAGSAGAHFSLIEENIAFGDSPEEIHQGWMASPGHHANLMNPAIDRIGISLVAERGGLYATADYAQSVRALSRAEIEGQVAAKLHATGLAVATDSTSVAYARAACAQDFGSPRNPPPAMQSHFLMRWQSSSLNSLPQMLTQRLHEFERAAVGACPAQSDGSEQAAFTSYRVAVLLF